MEITEITSSINSRVRLWKVVYFPVKHSWLYNKNKYLPFLQNILNELTCRLAMFCPAGKGLWGSWFSVLLGMLRPSSIRCACPQCDADVLVTPYLSSKRCACPRYSVPVLSTLSCPFAVPVLNTLCLFSIRCAYPKYVELAFRCAFMSLLGTEFWPLYRFIQVF